MEGTDAASDGVTRVRLCRGVQVRSCRPRESVNCGLWIRRRARGGWLTSSRP